MVRARVVARLTRLQAGLIGHVNNVGAGVHELKIDVGPGYRVYFGNDGKEMIILLAGGEKKTQSKDILAAKEYWIDYKLRKSRGKKNE